MSPSNELSPAAQIPGSVNLDRTAFLNTILESSTDYSIVALDLAGTILEWNEGARRIYGYTAAEVVGKENNLILDAPEAADRGIVKDILAETRQAGKWVGTLHRVRKNGERFTAHAAMTLRRSAAGESLGFTMISNDLTESERAARELGQSELKYRRLFESAKDGILILEASSGRIVEINPFVLQLLGYAAEECIGKQLWDIGFFKDVEVSKRLFEELKSTGYVRYEDMPLKTKDGRAVQVEFVSNVYAAGGNTVIQCNIRDITQRKRAEEGLRQMSSIIEGLDECIIGDSLNGVIQSWNPAAERLFGYSAKEIIGTHVSILCPAHLVEDQSNLRALVRSGRKVQRRETVRVGKDGKPFDVTLSLSQIKNAEGELTGYSAVIWGIAKSKQLEAQLRQSQKMEGIGRLAGGIAHDFNNLLTGIMGYSEFLLGEIPPTDPKRNDVKEIIRAGQRAAALTRQLLAFSRQQVLVLRVLDINAVVGELNKMLRRIIGEHIDLTFLPGGDIGLVKSDPGQIEQIVMNLCVNAKDAMPKCGKLLIETSNVELGEEYVGTHPHIKTGLYVMMAISDTGCGMNAEVLSHLFEPFFTTKERGKGTGLGLSTVYGIVQQSGGSIDVSSSPGNGTTFKIYLPRANGAILPAKERAPAPGSYRGNEVILLVEDDEMVRKFASRVLNESGYSILPAKTPNEAIRICERHKDAIHLMLTDVVMPEMLGYELVQRLASIKPEMKVIFMSGYTEQSIIQRALLQGASFIQKPMAPEAIVRQIRKVLDAPRIGA